MLGIRQPFMEPRISNFEKFEATGRGLVSKDLG